MGYDYLALFGLGSVWTWGDIDVLLSWPNKWFSGSDTFVYSAGLGSKLREQLRT